MEAEAEKEVELEEEQQQRPKVHLAAAHSLAGLFLVLDSRLAFSSTIRLLAIGLHLDSPRLALVAN